MGQHSDQLQQLTKQQSEWIDGVANKKPGAWVRGYFVESSSEMGRVESQREAPFQMTHLWPFVDDLVVLLGVQRPFLIQ